MDGPPPPPLAPAPLGGPPSQPDGDDAGGRAAAKARELIAELSHLPGVPSVPAQPPGVAPLPTAPLGAAPYLSGPSPVPSFGADPIAPIPSYAPTDLAGLGFPTAGPSDRPPVEDEEPPSAGQWSDGSEPPLPARPRRSRAVASSGGPPAEVDAPGEGAGATRTRRLPVLLLIGVLLLGGAYLVKTQLLDSGSDTVTTAPPPVRRASPTTTLPRALPPAELAASLKDPHFKHGYDAGKKRAATGAVAVADRDPVCRTMALRERADGYPWGAHDRAGCLVALAG